MSNIRVEKHEKNFTTVDNGFIHDENLSYRAVGILLYLLSKPPHWRANINHLASQHKEGREAVRSAFVELETAGYVTREWDRSGPTPVMEYVVHEMRTFRDAQKSGIPDSGYPENRPVVSTEVKQVLKPPSDADASGETLFSQPEPVLPPKPKRPPSPLWDALVVALRWEPSNKAERSRLGRAVKLLTESGATPAQVKARAWQYRQRFRNAALTPEALVKHWSSLAVDDSHHTEDDEGADPFWDRLAHGGME